jgi:hypothetical protein
MSQRCHASGYEQPQQAASYSITSLAEIIDQNRCSYPSLRLALEPIAPTHEGPRNVSNNSTRTHQRSTDYGYPPAPDLLLFAKHLFVGAIHLHHCSAPPLPSRLVSLSSIRRTRSGMTRSAWQRSQQRPSLIGCASLPKPTNCPAANRTDLHRHHRSALSPASLTLLVGPLSFEPARRTCYSAPNICS